MIEKVIRNLHLAGENRMLKSRHEEGIKFDIPFKEAKEVTIEGFERKYILGLLSRHNGNISRAAEGSGIDRTVAPQAAGEAPYRCIQVLLNLHLVWVSYYFRQCDKNTPYPYKLIIINV